MSITDELRAYVKNGSLHCFSDYLAIADRIDAEHQRQLDVLYRDMSDAEWVRLPKDADGEYIHIGDVMESKGSDFLFGEASFEVRSMRCDEWGWEVYDRLGDRYAPSLLCHYHEPTVEDVLREFALAVCKDDALTIRKDVVDEYAAKLRLVGDAE